MSTFRQRTDLAAACLSLTLACTAVAQPAEPPATAPQPPEPPAEQGPIARADARYAALLAELVDANGLVRYELLKDAERLSGLEQVVADYGDAALPDDRDERLAFWLNAYNANVLLRAHQAIQEPDFKTVNDVPGFFDSQVIRVAGEELTLNRLENDRIRPLGDPRIHAALVCAARSCPPLRSKPFSADDLHGQLVRRSWIWVNDTTKNRFARAKLEVSQIFKWYEADFDVEPYGGVRGFLDRFADPNGRLGRFLTANPNTRLEHLAYDWSLNQAKPDSRR
jgi:hypothetical protein